MLVCYFFESLIQMFLSLMDNFSNNPGCEFFSLTFDGSYDLNTNVGEVPEIELPICGPMPVIINTDIDVSV